MKSEIKYTKTHDPLYTKLVINNLSTLVVLVDQYLNNEYFSGTVVHLGNNARRYMGEYRSDWIKSEFHRFEDELTLAN